MARAASTRGEGTRERKRERGGEKLMKLLMGERDGETERMK
jgi:hypothetical protein